MPTLEIPLINVPRQRLSTSVNGQAIQLLIWYSPKSGGQWYASLEHPAGTKIVSGRRIVLNSDILASQPRGTFKGKIICRAIGDLPSEPGLEPWGTTHLLLYEE